ncbi:hypothetical protein BC940DRAFT_10525 [Gongronella butleri]|nr:hypothetical protein BC940DRAFT_10525 [Gongronella butleri]
MQVPANWFTLFEEARQRQRLWHMAIDRLHAGGDNERPGDDDEDDNHDHHHHPHDGTDNDPILLQYADAHTSYTQQHAHHPHPEATNVEETLSSISTLPLDAPPLHHGRITPPVGSSSRKTHFPLLSQAMHHHQSEEGPSSAHQRDTMVFSDERHGQEQPTITSETPSSIHEYATSRSIEATPRRVASTSSASLSNQQTDTQQQQHRRSLSVRSLKRLRHSLHGLF